MGFLAFLARQFVDFKDKLKFAETFLKNQLINHTFHQVLVEVSIKILILLLYVSLLSGKMPRPENAYGAKQWV